MRQLCDLTKAGAWLVDVYTVPAHGSMVGPVLGAHAIHALISAVLFDSAGPDPALHQLAAAAVRENPKTQVSRVDSHQVYTVMMRGMGGPTDLDI